MLTFPRARTTPAADAEIAHSQENSGALAIRYDLPDGPSADGKRANPPIARIAQPGLAGRFDRRRRLEVPGITIYTTRISGRWSPTSRRRQCSPSVCP
jgi:hypothetical protein